MEKKRNAEIAKDIILRIYDDLDEKKQIRPESSLILERDE